MSDFNGMNGTILFKMLSLMVLVISIMLVIGFIICYSILGLFLPEVTALYASGFGAPFLVSGFLTLIVVSEKEK